MIKIRKHFINLCILVVVWTASAFNYYLINFKLKSINGDVFINTTVASASEIVAYIVGGIAYQKVGIHLTLIVSFAISCVGAITLVIWENSEGAVAAVPFMIMATRFGVSATFNISYLANAQLFPAIFAGTAIGICNFFAKTSTIIAPMLAEVHNSTPMIVFAILTGAAAVISSFIIVDKKEKAETKTKQAENNEDEEGKERLMMSSDE